MKKGVIAVLLILVVIIIVSPGIVGKMAEKSVDDNLTWAVDQSAELIVTSEGFDRGWFSSEGKHRVELGDGNLRAALTTVAGAGSQEIAPALLIETHLDHGLIAVSSMGRDEGSLTPGLGSAVSTMTVQFSDGESFDVPGAIYSKVDLAGNLRSSYVLEAGTHQTDDGTVTWEPGNITVQADPKSGSVEFDGDMGSLSFDEGGQTMLLDGLKFSGEQEKTKYGFFIGNVDLEMGEMTLNSAGIALGGLKGMTLEASSDVDGGDVRADALLKVDGQNTPGFGEVSVIADMSMSGADAEALGALTKKLESLSGVQDPTEILMMAQDDMRGLFAGGFNLNLKQIDVALPMGTVETKMNIEIPESDPATFEWTSLFLGTVASFDAKVPVALIDMATQMNPQAGMIVGMGYLKKNGDRYEMDANYEKGLLTINGAPVPIPFGAFQ